MAEVHKNWAGNVSYQSTKLLRPESVDELQEVVAGAERIKALGSRHSFNGISDATAVHVSLEKLDRVIELDREARTVTFEAGMRYGELGRFLHREGFALHNLASLPHISVAGACATATHGSGDRNGNLAIAVVELEMITAEGRRLTLARGRDPEFAGAVVGLGALGILARLTLVIEPTFNVRQYVYESLPFEELERNFESIEATAYSVSLFTDWRSKRFHQVWLKYREHDAPVAEPAADFFGAKPADADRHPLPDHSAANCTAQMGVPGPWHERLPHFRLEFTPSSGEELQSEYFVPRENAYGALQALGSLKDRLARHIMVTEVRTIAADDLWMSPFCERASVAFHFTWKPEWPAVRELLPLIEDRLARFSPIPHWGKLFAMPPEVLQSRYPRLRDFRALAARLDPNRKFANEFLSKHVLGPDR